MEPVGLIKYLLDRIGFFSITATFFLGWLSLALLANMRELDRGLGV